MHAASPTLDIYAEWLGIPPGPRPPDHYLLLGVDRFTEAEDSIRKAARERMKLVRPRCLKYPELGTKLLNEIAAAQVCLLDSRQKATYDRGLPVLATVHEEEPLLLEILEDQEFELPDPVPDYLAETDQVESVGIDLGIGGFSIAWAEKSGAVSRVELSSDNYIFPTTAHLSPDGTVRLGAAAVELADAGEEGCFKAFPQNLGGAPFTFPGTEKKCTAERLCSVAMQHLIRKTSAVIDTVEHAVIAAPVTFTANQRWAIKETARLAGLKAARIIPAPVAACLAYARELTHEDEPLRLRDVKEVFGKRRILVVDQDQDSFEASILQLKKDGHFEVQGSKSDELFGGENWEETFFRLVCEDYKRDIKLDPMKYPKRMRELRAKSVEARRQLDTAKKALLEFEFLKEEYEITITREQFAEAADDLLQTMEWTLRRLLRQHRLDWRHVDLVLLVGPYSRIPMIRDMLSNSMEEESGITYVREQAKAIGAALYDRVYRGMRGK